MSELRVSKRENLYDYASPFDSETNYKKAMRYGSEELKKELENDNAHIRERNEHDRLEGIYNRAQTQMSGAHTENEFKIAAITFESIKQYRDSESKATACRERAEAARKDAVLANAKSRMTGTDMYSLESALEQLKSISGWKDADEQIYACQKKIEELKAKEEAERLKRERDAEIACQEAERQARKKKKIAAILAAVLCTVAICYSVISFIIIPAMYDSKCENVFGVSGRVGTTVTFGNYEQDNNLSNGAEPIEWIVLARKNNRVLIISKYALDCQQYNTVYADVTWETCTLRKWLNGTFLNMAFSDTEKSLISQDEIFLLSIEEVNQYFSSAEERQCKPTEYAKAQGAYVKSSNGNCWWWLRSPGGSQDRAADVLSDGDVYEYGDLVDYDDDAVRPALWIEIGE